MSINVRSSDLVTEDMGEHDEAYKQQTAASYQYPYPGPPQSQIPPQVEVTMPDGEGVQTDRAAFASGKISSVRRTFCLFVTFDLGLSFILWVIYTQLIGDTGWKAFERQVEDYNFKTSLFDTVMMAVVRFVFLLLAYALFRIRHWWTVAVTTFASSAFLIAKIFLYDFGESSKNPLSYCVLIVSFVLAWVETWFLDFKVLPWEKKELQKISAARQVHNYGSLGVGDRRRLLADDTLSNATFDQYYSPVGTPEGSDNEDDAEAGAAARALIQHNQLSEIRQLVNKSWDFLWEVINMEKSKWKQESGKSVQEGMVSSFNSKEHGKVFKLEAEVNMAAESLWKDMIHNISSSPTWNPTVVECSIIQSLDQNTDITYAKGAGIGGLVSSRDFVAARHWGVKDGVFLSAGHSITHPDRPPVKTSVRGFNGPGGWAFKPVQGEPDKCQFTWIMNMELKGWIPQRIVDQASTQVLLDYLKYLRQHVTAVKAS